ncbi:MAG: osmotically inducible protein C [Dictyoglomus sp. NZ13-RE01]|nr:MAG: osmotically inducible protein C [Dictyoglomus sp. NZ13-RE01]
MATNKTIKVSTNWAGNFLVEAKVREHTVLVDQPEASGGQNKGPTPLEYLFVSLGSCVVTIGLIVAKQKRLNITGLSAEVEGDINYDVLLGKEKEPRAGFYAVRVRVKVEGDLTKEEKEAFIKEVESRCPIADNLLNTTPIEVTVE